MGACWQAWPSASGKSNFDAFGFFFVAPSDGVFPRAFRVSFPTVNKGFRAIFDDLRAGLEQWAYVAFTGTLS